MTTEIVASGATLADAFARAALAVLAQAVDPTAVRPVDVREVRAHGASLETLLRTWISECCYVHELEGFACHTVDFAVFAAEPSAGAEPLRLHALLRGEAIDVERHGSAGVVKAPRSVSIEQGERGYVIRLALES